MKVIKIWKIANIDGTNWAWGIYWTEAGKEELDECLASGTTVEAITAATVAIREFESC